MLSDLSPGVYRITNTTTGRAYVGSSVKPRNRWFEHRGSLRKGNHSNQYLQRSWTLHGEGSFRFEVVLNCPKEQLVQHEQTLIDETGLLYNAAHTATPGSRHPRSVWTIERRALHSKAMRGNAHLRGKKHSPEVGEKISRALLGKTPIRGASWKKNVQKRLAVYNLTSNHDKPQNQRGRTLTDAHKLSVQRTSKIVHNAPEMRLQHSLTARGQRRNDDGTFKKKAR